MRILQVAFKNIHSLAGEHEIDFTKEPFSYSSLFAIIGSTGSGKSTILDVISLALFNNTPRMGRVSTSTVSSSGGIMTRGQKEAYAKVTYACNKGVYRSEWHISTARTGNLREYEMMLFDIQNDRPLDLKKSEVPPMNEELIGLNYSQFNKSVVLAQGEFAEFLKAPKNERGALLEKITGADIYRRVGQAVYEKNKEIEGKTKDLDVLLNSKLENQIAEEELKDKIKEADEISKKLEILGNSLEQLKEKNKRIKTILDKEKLLEQTLSSLKTLKADLNQFMSLHGMAWQTHKKLLPYLSDLQVWEQLSETQSKLKKQREQLKSQKEQLENNLKEFYAKISGITKTEITVKNAVEKLDDFNDTYEEKDKLRQELLSKFRELNGNANTVINSLKLQAELKPNSKTFKEDVQRKQAEIKNSFSNKLNQLKLQDIDLTDSLIGKKQAQLNLLRQAQLSITDIKNSLKNKSEFEARIIKLKNQHKELSEQTELLKTKSNLAQKSYENLHKELQLAKISQSLEEHRKQLKDGEPCPLCGALEHPLADHSPSSITDIEKQMDEAKEKYKDANDVYLKNLSNVESTLNTFKTEQISYLELEKRLNTQEEAFKTKFHSITESPHTFNFEEAIQLEEHQHNLLQKALVEKNTLDQFASLVNLASEITEVIYKGKEVKGELDQLYEGDDFKKVYTNLRDGVNTNKINLVSVISQEKQLLEELTETDKKLNHHTPTLLSSLTELGFEDIPNAIKARLKDSEYLDFENKHQSIQQNIQKATTQRDLQTSELEELKKEVSIEEKEQIEKELASKQDELNQLTKQKEDLGYTIKTQNELKSEIKNLKEQIIAIGKDTEHWAILNKLIGDSTGNKFNNIAQDMSLTHLLQLANKRLESLNSRYKIDKPLEGETDNLMVVDKDMGNQRRSVSTLSGGETFMLSLALALALSDLASKNIQIESMFIDEGFGTLDPESLDQTLDALERLQMESNKLIGVISHVDSLKERISTQIQLTQDGKGYSKMEIVG